MIIQGWIPRASPRRLWSSAMLGSFLLAIGCICRRHLPSRWPNLASRLVGTTIEDTLWLKTSLIAIVLHVCVFFVFGRTTSENISTDIGAEVPQVRLEFVAAVQQDAAAPYEHDAVSTQNDEGLSDNPLEPTEAQFNAVKSRRDDVFGEGTLPSHDDTTRTASRNAQRFNETGFSDPAAAPSSDLQESSQSAAPVKGANGNAHRIISNWERRLITHLARHKRYPGAAATSSGEVTLTFVLDSAGHVVSATVLKGSGNAAIDQAALAMLRRADPVPPPPPTVASEGLRFTMPVQFVAKHSRSRS